MRRALLAVALFVAGAALIPIRSLEAPLWRISVVDESNKPVANATVRERYQNYSAEFSSHEQDLTTNDQGYVVFPPKTIWVPLLVRGLAIVKSSDEGVHASYGPHVYVIAFKDGTEGGALKNGFGEDWTGVPAVVESRIILLPSGFDSK